MDFVRRQPQFSSIYRRWKFIAVCKSVDEDVRSRYKSVEDKGKPGLVLQVDNYEVYAFTWDDIFKSFDLRHSFILEKLNYDREHLLKAIRNKHRSLKSEGDFTLHQRYVRIVKTAHGRFWLSVCCF